MSLARPRPCRSPPRPSPRRRERSHSRRGGRLRRREPPHSLPGVSPAPRRPSRRPARPSLGRTATLASSARSEPPSVETDARSIASAPWSAPTFPRSARSGHSAVTTAPQSAPSDPSSGATFAQSPHAARRSLETINRSETRRRPCRARRQRTGGRLLRRRVRLQCDRHGTPNGPVRRRTVFRHHATMRGACLSAAGSPRRARP